MFRRKDEAYESGDLLADSMTNSDESFMDAQNAESKPEAKEKLSEDVTVRPQPAPAQAAASLPNKPIPAPAFRSQASAGAAAASRNMPASTESRNTNLSANPKSSKRVLTVGHDIHMKGEISTCDRLVIEGSVDASLNDVHTVEIAQSGSFKGSAEIEDAEISGVFEGDLIVNGRLIIYSTGKVSGNLSYGEIEIERGGQLSGNIKTADQIAQDRKAAA